MDCMAFLKSIWTSHSLLNASGWRQPECQLDIIVLSERLESVSLEIQWPVRFQIQYLQDAILGACLVISFNR